VIVVIVEIVVIVVIVSGWYGSDSAWVDSLGLYVHMY